MRIVVPGTPASWRAPRVGRNKRTGKVVMIPSATTERYEALVEYVWRTMQDEGDKTLTGPVRLAIEAIFPRPERLLARSKRTGELLRAHEGRMPAPKRPDSTNILKAVEDALTRAGAWEDDCQVCQTSVSKWYAAIGESPRTIIEVTPVSPCEGCIAWPTRKAGLPVADCQDCGVPEGR